MAEIASEYAIERSISLLRKVITKARMRDGLADQVIFVMTSDFLDALEGTHAWLGVAIEYRAGLESQSHSVRTCLQVVEEKIEEIKLLKKLGGAPMLHLNGHEVGTFAAAERYLDRVFLMRQADQSGRSNKRKAKW